MAEPLDLANSNYWEPVYTVDQAVTMLSRNTYVPMREIKVPIQLDNLVLAVFAESSTSPPRWKTAGWLGRKISLGLTVGANQNTEVSDNRRVLLNRIVLIQWQSFGVQSYTLSFFVHDWIRQIKLSIWKYTGPFIDSVLEEIELARIDVLRSEAKINLLLDRY